MVRMAGSESDITERKRAEQQISDTSQRLQALMQALPVGVSFLGRCDLPSRHG
ncbi:MAG: hypothetical protein MZW92_38125 [Comamonadaceae bacterium]|nr:hypothetical protein [Comamonadaceae bacterium]